MGRNKTSTSAACERGGEAGSSCGDRRSGGRRGARSVIIGAAHKAHTRRGEQSEQQHTPQPATSQRPECRVR